MSDWVLFEHIPGVRKVYVKDDGEHWLIRTDYLNADHTRDFNAAMEAQSHGSRFGDYRLLTSMPANEMRETGLEEAMKQGDDRFISRFLMDPDHRGYKATRGKV